MDLIYTDIHRKDVGVLKDYTFDLAFGTDENNFELVMDLNDHCCEPDCLVYIENTDYGGIIDGLGVATPSDQLVYKGRTWQGILASKIIEPDAGKAYLTVSGEANQVIGKLLMRCGLSELFVPSSEDSGLMVSGYSFGRYVDAYSEISKMLESVGGKLKFSFINGHVVVSALPLVDYSKDEQFDGSVEMEIEKTKNTVNHLVCLGKGELVNRQVVHLYINEDGIISTQQTVRGLQEITKVYDYPNAESTNELVKGGTAKLKEYAGTDKVQMDFAENQDTYDVGDLIGAKETITGIVTSAKITKKIVTIRQGEINIQYKVGE